MRGIDRNAFPTCSANSKYSLGHFYMGRWVKFDLMFRTDVGNKWLIFWFLHVLYVFRVASTWRFRYRTLCMIRWSYWKLAYVAYWSEVSFNATWKVNAICPAHTATSTGEVMRKKRNRHSLPLQFRLVPRHLPVRCCANDYWLKYGIRFVFLGSLHLTCMLCVWKNKWTFPAEIWQDTESWFK